MLFGKGGGSGDQKPSVAIVVVLIVVIAAAGFMLFRTMMGSRSPTPSAQPAEPGRPGAMPGGPMPPGLPMPPGAPMAPGAGPSGPAAPGGPPPQPGAAAPSPVPGPAPGPPAAPAPQPAPKPSVPKPAPDSARDAQPRMRQIKVFGTVNVSYPASWKITTGSGNLSAIFTDGKARFEVRSPDPKATSAKAMAESALKSLAKGAAVTAQGTDKIQGYDAHWIAIKLGSGTARIVGVDAPTRIVVFERVRGGSFAAYRETFNKMQASITFGG